MHRLKAYFGMVPAEELDDYPPEYAAGYRGYEDDYYDYYDYYDESDGRARPLRPEWAASHRRRRSENERPAGPSSQYETLAQHGVSGTRAGRRGGWPSDGEPAAVRGSLAVDAVPRMRDVAREPVARGHVVAEEEAHPLARIVTLNPRNYKEARPIGEQYRDGIPVIMNLTEMDDSDAKRVVDFAAGLAFALRGSIDKVTNKVFLISPPNVDVSAEDKRRIAEGNFFNQS